MPAIVTPDGGPRTIVRDGETGRIVPDDQFAAAITSVLVDVAQHSECAGPRAPTLLPPAGIRSSKDIYEAYKELRPRGAWQRARV